MGTIRKTEAVKALLSIFKKSETAFSAIELVELFREKMNKTTVYRVLERLNEDGILHSFNGKKGLRWYALCNGCTQFEHHDIHPHFQCKECGKTECLTQSLTTPLVPSYKIESAELLLIGKCKDCNL